MKLLGLAAASGMGGVVIAATLAMADETSEAGALVAAAIGSLGDHLVTWVLIALGFAVNFRAPLNEILLGLARLGTARLAVMVDRFEDELEQREHDRLVRRLDKRERHGTEG